ncbi:MAG: SpoIIE family protein phosphatase [Spirochaetia bacterium]|nr:SpoIIE family protein phosphatase [Spirochaetia bacterium]
MKNGFVSIKWEITAVISALVLAAILSMSYFAVKAQREALIDAMEAKGAELAVMAAGNAAEYLLVGYEIEAAKILKEMADNKEVKYALITDKKGMIIAHNDMTMAGKKFEAPGIRISITDQNDAVYRDDSGGKFIDFARPVVSGGKVKIGEIHVAMSYEVIEDALRRAYFKIFLITLVVLVLSVIASIITAGRLTGPIEALAKGAGIVGRGDLDHRIIIKNKNELGMLAGTFNSMTDGLKKAQEAALEKRAMEKELEIAREIQLSLIPQKMPRIKRYEITSYYQAARTVGGDYYDVIPLADNKSGFGIVMADVSGKGVPAALVMAMASSLLRAQAAKTPDPRECVVEFNRELFKRIRKGMFLTVFYGILDITENTLEFVSAAHNETIIYRKKTGQVDLMAPRGFPAGIGEAGMLEQQLVREKTQIDAGDKIIVYTDGVFEAINESRQQMGMEKFVEVVKKNGDKTGAQMKESINRAISDFTGDFEQFDDIAFLIIERTD